MKLADEFKAKVDKGEAKWASSGFSGKGFTFDDSEQSESQQVRATVVLRVENVSRGQRTLTGAPVYSYSPLGPTSVPT